MLINPYNLTIYYNKLATATRQDKIIICSLYSKMDLNSGILITKPTHFLNKEITIKSHQEFLKALTKLFSSVAFAQFQNLPSHLTDLMVQMNLELNEGETAWLLISLSFREALHELIDEYLEECPTTETNILENSLEKILGDSELKINNNFFYNSILLQYCSIISNI